MINVENLNVEEIDKYAPIFQACFDLFGDTEGVFYKLNIDGNIRLLYRMDKVFTLFSLVNDKVSYEMFAIDDDYSLSDIAFDEYEMHVVDGKDLFQKRDNDILSFLECFKRTNGLDDDGYSGIVRYIQYNPKSDMRVYLMYQQNVESTQDRIYPFHIKLPFQIMIEKHVTSRNKGVKLPFSKETFIKRTFDYRDEPTYFTLATMKDYGVGATMESNVVSLQESMTITRYYKELFITSDYMAFTGFPFCRQYKLEDIGEYISSLGFSMEVPQILLDYHNQDMAFVKYIQAIADYMRKIDEGEVLVDNNTGVWRLRLEK